MLCGKQILRGIYRAAQVKRFGAQNDEFEKKVTLEKTTTDCDSLPAQGGGTRMRDGRRVRKLFYCSRKVYVSKLHAGLLPNGSLREGGGAAGD